MPLSASVAPAATVAPAVETPEVSPGLIKRVQTSLKAQGIYKGRIDGVWGPQTQSAIHGYQQSHNLTDSRELDSQTLASLKTASASGAQPMPATTTKAIPSAAATTN
jgi:peptidoglycan hydrolase-like protein with peptidoglycan-binding domain